jgi:Uma2 family endonuclease
MSTEEFLAWAQAQPKGLRHELHDGAILAMAPAPAARVRVKQQAYARLLIAIAEAGLRCEAYVDGPGVRIDAATLYQPDVLARSGPPLSGDAQAISDPLIVIDVHSPSTRSHDRGARLVSYFSLPSLQHYLIVMPEARSVIHLARGLEGAIITRILPDGPVRLDPPGLTLDRLLPR